ncbi:ABC transporter ATP-binding protein [Phaeobacter sp. QD34_3]|uniref:ABC transporter ATP-binding protein n=1 Tax=unclassified Phaeobacter TaxID=2621772 RepID=UPI00237FA039|nr:MULTISPECIES: ABC transporter ATP-binding protein [unclassified Phaeobacter]MDE4133022.1 ABC transporter ATP-binding protein [Phaeobacter sp. QD34_3]MDE4136576.1 ABC transporter ATP-binding protein [Phaeobacter sp. QD34_24]
MSFQIQDLSVSYGKTAIIRALDDHWPKGQLTALIGCNGAGKSTLLRALAGLSPMQGRLFFSGRPLSPEDQRRQVAYMPQDTSAQSSLTVLEVVLLGRLGNLGLRLPSGMADAAMTALDTFGLTQLHDRQLDEISGGQRQLVFLTQALFRRPKVLLLDEPTAALDLRHQLLVLERLRQIASQNGTVIGLAMHDLNMAAQYADRFIGLSGGEKIASGATTDVLTSDNLRRMYGIEARVTRDTADNVQVLPLRAV